MASLYKKKRSPFWFVQYTDNQGKRRNRSTQLRCDDPAGTLEARALRAELERQELTPKVGLRKSGWDTWVPDFFERKCRVSLTKERYLDAWKWLAMWLQKEKLHSPRDVTYAKAITYLDWRTSIKKKSGKSVCRNTAILELKRLGSLMREAVRLGHADANPLANMDLRRDRPAKKPELTDAEIVKIREALPQEPEWMQAAFEIGLLTGCRLRETRIPMGCIDFQEKKITFPSPKGGEDRAFSIPMPSALEPLLRRLKAENRKSTLDFPFQPSRRWGQFMKKLGLNHLCFHCLRVTFITRLRRANVPLEAAMRLVNHASELIHRIYQREKVDDVAAWRDVLKFPGGRSDTPNP